MDFLTVFIIICIINSVLYFIDTLFKSCLHYPYIKFLSSTGLDIGLFRITLFTKVFNKTVQRWSSCKPRVLDMWLKLGVFATVFLIPLSITSLFISMNNIITRKTFGSIDTGVILEPMVPGINLPITDCSYYLFTIVVCSIVHELGHAIAALKENVNVSGIGFSAFFFVPVAYVQMNKEQLLAIHPKRQLRIFCAGIWNNMALAFSSYSLLILLPSLFSPIYEIGNGVTVMDIHKNSQIGGRNGIVIGDKLVAINDCKVSDTATWTYCLKSFRDKPAPGFCVNEDIIHELDQSVPLRMSEGGMVECCDENSESHLCFETLDDGNPIQIPQYSCLPGRPVIAGTAHMCTAPKDCPAALHCVRPVTPQGMTLLRIQRSHGNVVIFIGNPDNVLQTVDVSDYVKKFNLLPPRIPEIVTKLMKYFIIFSLSIAVINTIPCFYFDGHHITLALIRYMSPHTDYRGTLGMFLNIVGTTLLTLNLSCVIWVSILGYV